MSKTHELLLEGLLEHGRLRSHQLFSRVAASPEYNEQTVRMTLRDLTFAPTEFFFFFIGCVQSGSHSRFLFLQKAEISLDKGELQTVFRTCR